MFELWYHFGLSSVASAHLHARGDLRPDLVKRTQTFDGDPTHLEMGLHRSTSLAQDITTMSSHASSSPNSAWDTGLHVVRTRSCEPPTDADMGLGGWPHDGFTGLKIASLPVTSSSCRELLIIALLKLCDASHQLLLPDGSARTSNPLNKLFRKVRRHPKLGDLTSDSSTLEQMLRKVEAEMDAAVVEAPPHSEVDSLLSCVDDEQEMDLDALDDLDELYSVSDSFGWCSPLEGRCGLESSVRGAFNLVENSGAEYDAHFSSSFVKKAGSLARNDACVDLAQLHALVCDA